jgi:hypothetical protein
MSDDNEMKAKMADLTSLLNMYNGWQNLNQEFALHLTPEADMKLVADGIVSELKRQKSTVYCLSAGRSSVGNIVVVVKFRENR